MRSALASALRRAVGPAVHGRARALLDRFSSHRSASWSQFGEDLFLARYFADRSEGVYVDVGAFHPRRFSNTHRLYRRGWRGLNVDATPGSMKRFDALRPGDVNVEAAVSDSPEPVWLHAWGLDAENTLRARLAEVVSERRGAPDAVIELSPRTLTAILDESELKDREIDLLNVDTEGSDLAVLRSLDWSRYRPRIVIAEWWLRPEIDDVLESRLYAFFTEHGYRLVAWHRPSLIFERRPEGLAKP